MPHECTNCETVYPNGTEAILSGCPECGWNRFRYIREEAGAPRRGEGTESGGDTIIDTIERAHESGGEDLPTGDGIESVKILEEGSYEINVSSLLEKKEIIMSIGESGKYVVHLPSAFRD